MIDRKTALVHWIDTNCKCHLKLGLSAEFLSMVKASSNTTDPIDSIFRDPHEEQILKKRTQGMGDNYSDVQN